MTSFKTPIRAVMANSSISGFNRLYAYQLDKVKIFDNAGSQIDNFPYSVSTGYILVNKSKSFIM